MSDEKIKLSGVSVTTCGKCGAILSTTGPCGLSVGVCNCTWDYDEAVISVPLHGWSDKPPTRGEKSE